MAQTLSESDQQTKAFGDSPVTGSVSDIAGTFGMVVGLNVPTIGGTTGGLDVKLQHSPDKVTWFDIPGGTFAQITGANVPETLEFPDGTLFRFVRQFATIGGDRNYVWDVHYEGRA